MIYQIILILLLLLILYFLLAYVLLPSLWKHYEHNRAMENFPKKTCTATGIPGDPINVALMGSEEELIHAMLMAGWVPADPITFSSAKKIVMSVLKHKEYLNAPVSNLYLWERKEDFAFEIEVGGSAKTRHHVRLWKAPHEDGQSRPLWIGAATYDISVGLSHNTGQITHHIDSNIDAERDHVMETLKDAKQLVSLYEVSGVDPSFRDKNGGGDVYYTDGEVKVGVLSPENKIVTQAVKVFDNPWQIDFKNKSWDLISPLLENINKNAP